jgi:hypothetical protein
LSTCFPSHGGVFSGLTESAKNVILLEEVAGDIVGGLLKILRSSFVLRQAQNAQGDIKIRDFQQEIKVMVSQFTPRCHPEPAEGLSRGTMRTIFRGPL